MSSEQSYGAPTVVGADPVERLLGELNPAQREAVTHGEGPLLVLAGAGSGKTRVLTHRIAWLLATGRARPGEILAITFTNKAADEMRERVGRLIGGVSRAMWVMTFHSACARILRAEAERLGYKRAFTIYDEADSLRMVKRCLDELEHRPEALPAARPAGGDLERQERAHDAVDYAESVAGSGEAGEVGRAAFERVVAEVYELYERRMLEANAMDFDDLLLRTVNLLELFADVRDRYRAPVPLGARRRVPGHQPRPVPAPAAARRRAPQPDRRRRRLPVDLLASAAPTSATSSTSSATSPTPHGREARAELPLDADDPRRRQRADRAQPQQKPKRLWTEGARGDPIVVGELDDEHAEARYVAVEIDRLVEEGTPRDRDRGLLPRQRAEPGARGHAGPLRDPLPGDRRHEVLRAGRDQGRDRLPAVPLQPRRRGLVRAPGQLAAAWDRRQHPGAAALAREHDRRRRLTRSLPSRTRSRASARRRSRRSRRFAETIAALRDRAELGGPVAELLEAVLRETGYVEALEAERTIEAEGRIENLDELVGVAGEFDANRELEGEESESVRPARWRSSWPRSRSSPSRTGSARPRAS